MTKPAGPAIKATADKQRKHLRASDVRGIAQLATAATVNVSHIAEGVHQSVWGTLGMPGGKPMAGKTGPGKSTGGLTGFIYKSIRGITALIGKGADVALAALQPLLDAADEADGTPQREAVLAAINGVMGDRLAATNNPLATTMSLRFNGLALNWQAMPDKIGISETGGQKVLLLIHGLCMNDLQWQTEHDGQPVNHGDALATALGYVPVYLRYNSGKHVSENGRELAAQLAQLVDYWPQRITELTVVAHSMGGLVIRSAVHVAVAAGMDWPSRLKNIIFLGTPHHGAPLERAGHWVDNILGSTPYSAPFSRLAQLRSAGITDLRYGNVIDADWQDNGAHPNSQRPDHRQIVPLPAGVACYAIAATTAARRSALANRLLGDGLVPLHSALGEHAGPQRNLGFAKTSKWIAYRTVHMALLSSPAVLLQLIDWLAPQGMDKT